MSQEHRGGCLGCSSGICESHPWSRKAFQHEALVGDCGGALRAVADDPWLLLFHVRGVMRQIKQLFGRASRTARARTSVSARGGLAED